jgi:glycosyltransferase involved in cell wall biosynthesis
VDIEVVVVDDGSTDATYEHLSALDDPRLRIVRHEQPRGVAQARNAGINAATGAWIAFLDDDDLWAPQKLRLQLDAAEERDALFVYGGAAAVAENRSWLYSLAPVDPADLRRTLLSRNVLWGGSSNVVVRSDAVRELGGFDERLFQLCDWDLWIRLALAGESAACAEIVVACIVHPGSMLLVSKGDVLDELDYLEEKHRAARQAHGVQIDRRTFTRWVALGRRRAGRRLESAATYMRGAVRNRDPGNVARAFAALLDVPAREWWARLRGHPHGDGRIVDAAAEPAWLSLYRGDDARKIAAARSKASSPTDR